MIRIELISSLYKRVALPLSYTGIYLIIKIPSNTIKLLISLGQEYCINLLG